MQQMNIMPFSLIVPSNNSTSREDFEESWITEMPMGIPAQNYYPNIVQNIKERIDAGMTPVHIKDNLYRIIGATVVHYWYEIDGHIMLGSELTRRPQSLVVNFTAKDPKLTNNPPYASQLYAEILDNSQTPIRLVSDQSLSNEGLQIWKRLLKDGYQILVYDLTAPGSSRNIVSTEDDLLKYFKNNDPDFKKYQYVLLKPGEILAETISVFNTRRVRELAGIL